MLNLYKMNMWIRDFMNTLRMQISLDSLQSFFSQFYTPKFLDVQSISDKLGVPSVTAELGNFLHLFSSVKAPKKVLELGTGIGLSSMYIKTDKIERIDTVEASSMRYELARKNLENNNLNDKIKIYNSDAYEYIGNCDTQYDFIFVDIVKKDYAKLFYLLQKNCNKDTVIIFDDIFMYGYLFAERAEIPPRYRDTIDELRSFIAYVCGLKSYSSYILPVDNGVFIVVGNG